MNLTVLPKIGRSEYSVTVVCVFGPFLVNSSLRKIKRYRKSSWIPFYRRISQ
jgi:hypothetical protein